MPKHEGELYRDNDGKIRERNEKQQEKSNMAETLRESIEEMLDRQKRYGEVERHEVGDMAKDFRKTVKNLKINPDGTIGKTDPSKNAIWEAINPESFRTDNDKMPAFTFQDDKSTGWWQPAQIGGAEQTKDWGDDMVQRMNKVVKATENMIREERKDERRYSRMDQIMELPLPFEEGEYLALDLKTGAFIPAGGHIRPTDIVQDGEIIRMNARRKKKRKAANLEKAKGIVDEMKDMIGQDNWRDLV